MRFLGRVGCGLFGLMLAACGPSPEEVASQAKAAAEARAKADAKAAEEKARADAKALEEKAKAEAARALALAEAKASALRAEASRLEAELPALRAAVAAAKVKADAGASALAAAQAALESCQARVEAAQQRAMEKKAARVAQLESGLESCQANAEERQGACEDDCSESSVGCYQKNRNRPNALAGCDATKEACQVQCRPQVACEGAATQLMAARQSTPTPGACPAEDARLVQAEGPRAAVSEAEEA
ncbi:MAG: hypothetical protein FJ095_21300, partial [Deltaproteobacteria bacterium]|nr:hypothetical protein [Deltaproteobacteria bacterium]